MQNCKKCSWDNDVVVDVCEEKGSGVLWRITSDDPDGCIDNHNSLENAKNVYCGPEWPEDGGYLFYGTLADNCPDPPSNLNTCMCKS